MTPAIGLRLSAFARGLPVSAAITKDYLRQITVTICPVSGVELTQGTLSDTDWSVDRLENDLGYVPGNICFMSARANQLKGTAGFEELVDEAAKVLLEEGPSGYGKDLGNGLLVIEALRLAALAAAPAGYAKGMIGDFIPVAMAPMAWVAPRAKIAAVHVASARSRVEGAAQRIRFAWFRRLGKDMWRVSNRLVEEARSFLGNGLHPCDIWLHPDLSLRLVELTDALAKNPLPPPPGMSGEQLLQIIDSELAPVRDYRRLY